MSSSFFFFLPLEGVAFREVLSVALSVEVLSSYLSILFLTGVACCFLPPALFFPGLGLFLLLSLLCVSFVSVQEPGLLL